MHFWEEIPIEDTAVTRSMSGLITIAILLILVGVVAGILMVSYVRRPKVHTIDTVDLMRLDEARQSHPTGRRRRTRWVIMATGLILLASIFWGLVN